MIEQRKTFLRGSRKVNKTRYTTLYQSTSFTQDLQSKLFVDGLDLDHDNAAVQT